MVFYAYVLLLGEIFMAFYYIVIVDEESFKSHMYNLLFYGPMLTYVMGWWVP